MNAPPLSGSALQEGDRHGGIDDSALRTICIAVDDYGLHPGINSAALQLAEAERVHAIGCMVGGAAWPQGVQALVDLDHRLQPCGGVDLGLHLDLTEVPGGPFAARPLWRLMLDAWSRRIDRPRLRAEIRRQLDAFERAVGRPPDYVDGHQHVHQFPVVRSLLVEELQRRGDYGRTWLRNTGRPASSPGVRRGRKSWVIAALGARALTTAAQRVAIDHNRALLGVHDFSADARGYADHLRQWLSVAHTADLLMCHPSLAFDGPDPIIKARMAEFETLSGAAYAQLLNESGIVLQPMSRILARVTPSERSS